jgi:hypothetical protein
LQFIAFHRLDRQQYDACVLESICPVPYALSDYLFAVQVDRWGAWVWLDEQGRYAAVMPIAHFRKWGLVPYVAMPPFVQRLGVFARPGHQPDGAKVLRAWSAVKSRNVKAHYSFWQQPEGMAARTLNNLILPLKEEYPALAASYSKGLRDNLRKGRSLWVRPTNGGGITWRLFVENVAPRLAGWNETRNRAWVRLYFQKSPHYRFLHLGAFKQEEDAMPLATASFVVYKNRLVYLMGASTPEGLATGAMARLIDDVVREHAASNRILDFEGGAMAGTGTFFRSFGASGEAYFVK